MTILVVEDDHGCREMICSALEEAGYGVLAAENGAEALHLLLAEDTPAPKVIVLDLWLPVMSGPELMRVLRSYHRFSHIPVILTSAGPRYDSGKNDTGWLPKPFDADRLIALVNERACPT